MLAKILRFTPMVDVQPFPADRSTERTGVRRCTACLAEMDADKYFANDHVCDSCAERSATA
jgi:hypothetical protein